MKNPFAWARLRWHLYRTPFAKVVKAIRRWKIAGQLRDRRKLLLAVPRNAIIDNCAADLSSKGYCSISELVDAKLLSSLSVASQAKLERANEGSLLEGANSKDFWVRLLDDDMESGQLPPENPFVAIALQPELVSVVTAAMGEVPLLDYVLLTLSRYTDKQFSYSQLWHRDYDDTKVIKLFFYLTDVASPDDGPFTFIPGPDSDTVPFRLKSHLSDRQLGRWVPKSAVTTMYGPRLTGFMVDTSRCFHMGSRVAPGHGRLLYTATYLSAPRLYPDSTSRFILRGDETRLTRALLIADH